MIPSCRPSWFRRRIVAGINYLQLYLTKRSDGGNSQEGREGGQDGGAALNDECVEEVYMRFCMAGI